LVMGAWAAFTIHARIGRGGAERARHSSGNSDEPAETRNIGGYLHHAQRARPAASDWRVTDRAPKARRKFRSRAHLKLLRNRAATESTRWGDGPQAESGRLRERYESSQSQRGGGRQRGSARRSWTSTEGVAHGRPVRASVPCTPRSISSARLVSLELLGRAHSCSSQGRSSVTPVTHGGGQGAVSVESLR